MAMPIQSVASPRTMTSTLRSLLDARKAEGRPMSIEEAIEVIVPVCLDLQQRHARGERLYVHPSAIAAGADGLARLNAVLAVPPTHPHDRACVAPEFQRTLEPGDVCASVYSVGVILYEMVTGQAVGPAMARPSEINPTVSDALEALIGKAIIGDRAHRPTDIGALASAMYNIAPRRSIHPPDVSQSRLDQSAELDVDIRFSMLPPHEIARSPDPSSARLNARSNQAGDPYAAPAAAQFSPEPVSRTTRRANEPRPDDPTAKLSALKAHLESDPRPRYVVSKDKMDHGPFSAVELLQQIGSHNFTGDDGLRDEISGRQTPISEWDEFAPFAAQARLLRDKRAEDKAVVRAASADKKSGIAKSILALSVVIALTGALAVWFFARRGTRNEDIVVSEDQSGTVDVTGDIKGRKRRARGAGHGAGGGGPAGGMSYEAVLNSNNESISMGAGPGAADLTNGQLSAPLRSASFISACGAPDSMKVTVRAAIRMGVPIGVTVTTNPPNASVAGCIDRSVRGLRWPANAKTDFVTTSY